MFYYLCVVTLQYVAPLIICLFFTFILKTLGGYSWSGLFSKSAEECPISDEEQIINSTSIVRDSVQNIFNSTKEFHMAIENLKMVSRYNYFYRLPLQDDQTKCRQIFKVVYKLSLSTH